MLLSAPVATAGSRMLRILRPRPTKDVTMLGDITTTGVRQAIVDYDAVGRDAILRKHGFARFAATRSTTAAVRTIRRAAG